ncbi:MAG TPA: hypothetical protein VFB72_01240 [Verrucomicrobiae bacterium]|nr:hypothetical protein [Verrucomicrobiae bacterium]
MNKLKKQGVEMTRGLRSKIVNMAMRASGKEAAERILKIHELERGSPKSE